MYLRSILTPPIPAAQGIRYGAHLFTEPKLFPSPLTYALPGVYAVMVQDISMKPRPFRLLYIGESSNMNDRCTLGHEKFLDWRREAGTLSLYIAYRATIGTTQTQRKAIEAELIEQYNPPCNVKANPLSNLSALARLYRPRP